MLDFQEAAVAVAAPVVEAVVVKAVAAVAKASPEPAQKSQPKPEKKKIVSCFDFNVLLYVKEALIHFE